MVELQRNRFLELSIALVLGSVPLSGCKVPVNNNETVTTAIGRIQHSGQSVYSPLPSQPVAAQWVQDIQNSIPVTGSVRSFQGVTLPYTNGEPFFPFPTFLQSNNDEMPAYWNVEWSHPPSCIDISAPPYPPLANPLQTQQDFEPILNQNTGPQLTLVCYTNSPANPDFVPSNVIPQFALDDAIPATLQVSAFQTIQAAPSITNLHVFATDLSNPTNVSAISVAPDGSAAAFPYPRQSNGSSLPAGAYITMITTDPSNSPQTANGMEPFYIGHDDTSFTGAYGVAVAVPTETTLTRSSVPGRNGTCTAGSVTSSTKGGTPVPLVTLLTQGQLAVGRSNSLIQVGKNPTAVLGFNSELVSVQNQTPPNSCGYSISTYSGAQSALVVNTGDNTVSIVEVGYLQYPTGVVAVGTQPVAAAINSDQTFAYIANYGDNTVSEVDLANLIQTRTIAVMQHPASVTFDANGNLWVGGQGAVTNININNWSIASTTQVDGTVNGMSYDTPSGLLLQTTLQNGNVTAPSNGGTNANVVAYSSNSGTSYSTQTTFSVATGATTAMAVVADNSPYTNSSVVSYLAFPGQTAFSPPVYSATNGDITASVNGSYFNVSVVGTGEVLIQGQLPHPARSVALTGTMLYFTMPETNSLVTVPLQIPQ